MWNLDSPEAELILNSPSAVSFRPEPPFFSPDGRFVMVKEVTETLHADELVLVEGWFSDLERLASSEE